MKMETNFLPDFLLLLSDKFQKMFFLFQTFEELTVQALYKILDLRNKVFVVEQACIYLDTDFKDQYALHMLGMDNGGALKCYCRILAPGISFEKSSSIGRIITAPDVRGTGLGKQMVNTAIAKTLELFPDIPIQIEAQSYLLEFYQHFGFTAIGEEYLLDGIPHHEMILWP